jgi:hypothetical protein
MPIFLSPILHAFKITTGALKVPTSHSAELEINRFKIRIGGTHQRLTEIIKTVPQMMWIWTLVMIMHMLHLLE